MKYNIGKTTVNNICKSEKRLKNFKMAKCELGISKVCKRHLKRWKLECIVNWTVLFICGSDRISPTEFHRRLYAESPMCCVFVWFCSFVLNLKNSIIGFFAYPFRFLKVLSQLDRIIEEALCHKYGNQAGIFRMSFGKATRNL